MYSSWFRLSFFINNEQIETNLNSVLIINMVKYDVEQYILINLENFWRVQSHFLEYLFIISQFKKCICFRVMVLITSKVVEDTSIFLRFQSILSVKWILIMNGKKALFTLLTFKTYLQIKNNILEWCTLIMKF